MSDGALEAAREREVVFLFVFGAAGSFNDTAALDGLTRSHTIYSLSFDPWRVDTETFVETAASAFVVQHIQRS